MSDTLISVPHRGYSLSVKVEIDVEGDRANFLADAEKLKDGLGTAFDQAIKKAAIDD